MCRTGLVSFGRVGYTTSPFPPPPHTHRLFVLTETDVLPAIPPHGFVHDYVKHAIKQTTSPLGYHLIVGLGILAATCPLEYGMEYAGDTLRANIFGLLVGRSGEDQKSTAVSIGRRVLYQASNLLVGDFPGSAEGMVESLQRCPSQMLPMSEFGRFLASARSGYFEPMKATLTDLWDSQPQTRAKANGKIVRVDNPRLTILSACSLPYLEKYTAPEDWTGGFMGRWAVMYCHRERTDPDPKGDSSMLQPLADNLTARASVPNVHPCLGMTPQALRLWTDWFYDVSARDLPEMITGIRARAPTICRKVALLYAWDWLRPVNAPWYVEYDDIDYAIRFTELHIRSVVGISHAIVDTPDARARREMIEAIQRLGGHADLGQLVRVLRWRKRTVQETVESLTEERKVNRNIVNGEWVFTLRSDAEVEALEKARYLPADWE